MFKTYRKKPVEIQAVQFDGAEESAKKIASFSPEIIVFRENQGGILFDCKTIWLLKIKTLEGIMAAYEGDWIIKGVKGEFYPCKDDIFKMTYEAVM